MGLWAMRKSCISDSNVLSGTYCLGLKTLVLISIFISFFIVLFPDYITLPLGGYATQRFALVILCGFLLLISFLFLAIKGFFENFSGLLVFSPTLVLILGLLLAPVIDVTNRYAWVEPGMYSFYFLSVFMFGILLVVSGLREFYFFVFFTVSGIFFSVYGLISICLYSLVTLGGVGHFKDFIPLGFANVRYWSHVATWCIPLIPVSLCFSPLKGSRCWQVVAFIGLAIWWWMLFVTASRGAILGIIFGVTFVGLLFGRNAMSWIKLCFFGFLIGVLLWLVMSVIFLWVSPEDAYSSKIKMDSSGRIALFFEAWSMSLKEFPFGMGAQSWLTHDVITASYENGKKFAHPHNMYLMWAAEYGWFAVGLMSILVMQAIRSFFLCRSQLYAKEDSEKQLLLAGFTASVSAALLHAGVSAIFMAPASMLIGVWVLSGFWSIVKSEMTVFIPRNFSLRGHKFKISCMAGGAGVIAVLWLLWANEVKDYYNAMRSDELSYDLMEKGVQPRFWLHGDFPRSQEPVK